MDETLFILASGPSQRQEDIDAVRGRGKVLAINNQLFAAPWADYFYTADVSWFNHYTDAAVFPELSQIIADYRGKKLSSDRHALSYGCRIIQRGIGEGLHPTRLNSGNNSGYQAINLAFLLGFRRAVLLGYDMKHGPNGEHHNHPDHPKPMGNFSIGMPELCQPKFPQLAKDCRRYGFKVINASRDTALLCFERQTLSEVLAHTPCPLSAGSFT